MRSFVRTTGLPGSKRKSAFSTWFYRIVYNVCTTVLRRRGHDIHLSLEGGLGESHPAAPPAERPDGRLEERELEQIVSESIDALPTVYRGAFTLFVVQEMSYEEIADVMDLPLNTVKTRLFRARTLLRERFRARTRHEVTERRPVARTTCPCTR